MAAQQSFDISTGADLQEVDNAVNQAKKELIQRYDFKGSKASIEFDRAKEPKLVLVADDDFKMTALFDLLQGRLIKRGVPVKNLVIGATVACSFYASGKILNYFVPSVHNLAWMVLVVAVCNIAGIIPAYIINACYSWFKFVMKAFVGIVLLAILSTLMLPLEVTLVPTFLVVHHFGWLNTYQGLAGPLLIDAFGDDRFDLNNSIASGAAGGNMVRMSDSIFAQYLVPFEVVSILLLAALVGAIVVARRD